MHRCEIILTVWLVYALALNFVSMRRAPHWRKVSRGSRGLGERLRILIVGATGGTGLQLVRQALEQGPQVTTFDVANSMLKQLTDDTYLGCAPGVCY